MNKAFAIIAGLVLLVMLLLFTTTYTVSFHEVAVVTRFGQAADDSIVHDEGLHFKMPFFVDQVTKFDTRLQLVETPMEPVQIADGQQLLIQAYLMWRVREDGTGPLDFYRSHDSLGSANRSLADQLTDAVAELGTYNFDQLLGPSSSVAEAEERIRQKIAQNVASAGIDAQVVGISKILLPPRTTTSVLARMKTSRDNLALNHRTQGEADGARILADANTKADKLRAFAAHIASELRALGDTKAGAYLAGMAERDEEFAIFLTWLDTMETAFGRSTTLILPMDMAPMHLMDLNSPRVAGGAIPVPQGTLEGLTGSDRATATSTGEGQ